MTTRTEPPTGTQRPRRLYRRRADAKIAGVAAGIADYFGIDPIWIRLLFVVTTVAGGAGLVGYIVLWILAPVTDEPAPAPATDAREALGRLTSTSVGTIAVVLGVLLIATMIFENSRGVFWGLALIGIGAYLFVEKDKRSRDAQPRPADAPPPEPSSSESSETEPAPTAPPVAPPPAIAAGGGEPPPMAPLASPASSPRPPRRAREGSPLGAVTLGAALVVLGLLRLVDTATDTEVRLVQYFAAALLVLGIGIAVGTWFGRARWLTIPALALLPLTLVANTITLPLDGEFGNRHVHAGAIEALEPAYHLAGGYLELDLDELAVADPADMRRVRATVTLGRIWVSLPTNAAVIVNARVGVGAVSFQGEHTGGFDIEQRRRYGPEELAPVLWLDLETSMGSISVWGDTYSGLVD